MATSAQTADRQSGQLAPVSASEKLKALNATTPLEKYEIDLFGVLPQIVAVVEAAEASVRVGAHGPLGAALTALEEALDG